MNVLHILNCIASRAHNGIIYWREDEANIERQKKSLINENYGKNSQKQNDNNPNSGFHEKKNAQISEKLSTVRC